jgi:biofilm PGA synthesis N-glycosyltransferase PgaC
MISFYLFWCLGYFGMVVWLAQKWPKPSSRPHFSPHYKSVSLIIPFRNEIKNAKRLLTQLQKISSPDLQIILVDDQSEDGSYEFFVQNQSKIAQFLVIKSPGIGKKSALEHGIRMASGELILTTDADCQFPDYWVESMRAPFSNAGVQLVAGPVLSVSELKGFFAFFQQIEWASILLVTQYFFSKKAPLMCSGANLAFRKSAFLEVDGYQGNAHLLSGDDEFLLKKISRRFGGKSCVYLPFRETLVTTDPHFTWSDLLNQRIRWAGKWSVHRSFSHGLTAVFSFLAQLIWIGSLGLFFLGGLGWFVFGTVWGIKIGAERMAMGKVLGQFEIKLPFPHFVLTCLTHPVYVLAVGLGALRGKFIWKGRSN